VQKLKQTFRAAIDHPVLFWVIVAALYCVARLATWGYPYDSDHWIFYYVGKIWGEGGQLYVNAWDHKPPLIFAFNALMNFLAGDNIVLHRIWLTLISVATMLLFYAVARRVISQLLALHTHRSHDPARVVFLSRIALLLFVFLANLSQFTSSGNNTENYGLFFLMGMWYMYYLFTERRHWWYLALAGVGLSCLFFLKGTFVLFGLPIVILLVVKYRRSLSKLFGWLAMFGLPVLLQGVWWIGYFAQQGTLNDFFVASFSFSAKYANSAWHGGVSNEPLLTIETFLVIIPAVIALAVMLRDSKKGIHNEGYLMLGTSLMLGLLAVLSVGSFYPYYLQIIMPFIVLVCVYAAVRLRLVRANRRWMLIGASAMLLLFFYAVSTKQLLNNFTGSAAWEADEYQQVADYVRSHTQPGDKVFDDSYGATFYQLAGRDSGSRFVSASVLLLDYRDHYGYDLDSVFIGDMEQNQTTYVVTTRGTNLYAKNIPVTEYLQTHYHLEKQYATFDVLRRND
jgi:4-amino-4-deoxy-L-arabinose transferase-like glycosyltransferase